MDVYLQHGRQNIVNSFQYLSNDRVPESSPYHMSLVRRLVDPLQYEMSIQAEDLAGYVPAFGWEAGPPTEQQATALEKLGILPDAVESAGKASLLLDRLNKRRAEGLTTPKQIRVLERYGFQSVGTWSFDAAKHMIDRIAVQGWRGVPKGVNPKTYTPAQEPPTSDIDFGW